MNRDVSANTKDFTENLLQQNRILEAALIQEEQTEKAKDQTIEAQQQEIKEYKAQIKALELSASRFDREKEELIAKVASQLEELNQERQHNNEL